MKFEEISILTNHSFFLEMVKVAGESLPGNPSCVKESYIIYWGGETGLVEFAGVGGGLVLYLYMLLLR